MKGETVFLGLGTNLSRRTHNLSTAIRHLSEIPAIQVMEESCVYETEPLFYRNQPGFLNQVIRIETNFHPKLLLQNVKRIEKKMGRKTEFRNGPRIIDIDILAYERITYDSDELVVPHPGIPHRRFVLVPWAGIAENFLVPRWNKTVSYFLENTTDTSIVTNILNSRTAVK